MQKSKPYRYPLTTRLTQRIFRIWYRNRLNAPFVSQAFFRSLANYVIDSYEDIYKVKKRQFADSEILYVKSSLLKIFLESHDNKIYPQLIFSGSSDSNINFYVNSLLPDSVQRIYIQNSQVSDEIRVFTLPIGLEDASLGLNGMPYRLRPEQDKLKKVLIGPFSDTHGIRQSLLNLETSDFVTIHRRQCSPGKYAKIANKYLFIACPRGNGLDTHRIWETLYRGGYPIVLKDKWSKSLNLLNLPIVLMENWSQEQLEALIESDAENFSPLSYESLWAEYWIRSIRKYVKQDLA